MKAVIVVALVMLAGAMYRIADRPSDVQVRQWPSGGSRIVRLPNVIVSTSLTLTPLGTTTCYLTDPPRCSP